MFPTEMTEMPLWLIFKLVDKGDGTFSKPPVSPISGEVCAKTDEGKYTDFNRAMVGVEQHDADGVGFVFLHGFMAIDLDDCFQEDGYLKPMAEEIFEHFKDSYVEYSPSGNGMHIFCQGEKPWERTRTDVGGEKLEVYSGYNFVTVTGDHVPESGTKVLNMQSAIDWLFGAYLPKQESPNKTPALIEVEHGDKTPVEWLELGLKHDSKLHALYTDTDHIDDESSHDMALLCKLAYWLNKDAIALENEFLSSPWCDSKDQYHQNKISNRSDYFTQSIDKALAITDHTALENERKFKNIPNIKLRISENADGELIVPLADYTDVGNAKAFAAMYGEALCYTTEWGWCYYNGFNWEIGQEFQAQQCAVEFGESLMYTAKQMVQRCKERCEEEGVDCKSKVGKEKMEPASALMSHACKTQSARGIHAMLDVAKGMMIVPASSFDSNAWELNTPNCVVDLRTGETYPPAWNHYNSKMTMLPYNENATSNGMWDAFLDSVFCKDGNLIDYVQMQLGAACVGKVYEENLVIATGGGSNGKSTLFGAVGAVLGDYYTAVNPDVLMAKASYEQQITAAALKGRRLVVGQETESGQTLSTASVKRMVSTDDIVGRVLNQGYIHFTPTHTLVLSTNHLPKVKDNDDGTWRRLIVIPFNAHFTSEDAIRNYQDVLLSEDGDYIMRWLVEGAKRFYENGCSLDGKPMSVKVASNAYRDGQQDSVDLFMQDCIQFVDARKYPGRYTFPADVYTRYLAWCRDNGMSKPLTKIALGRFMGDRGMTHANTYVSSKKTTVQVWKDVVLKNEDGTEIDLVKM